jgi:hypothetical protein
MDILKCVHLPFAGITLFRFYGCNLSLQIPDMVRKHPGKTVKLIEFCQTVLLNVEGK